MNILLKNIPIKIHRYFKLYAKKNHRSLNQGLIEELSYRTHHRSRQEAQAILASVRKLRNQLPPVDLSIEEIEAAVNEGRE